MPNLSAREMLSQLPLRMATGGEASEALRRAQQAGDQGVQDYYANLRNLATSYIANADAPTGADAYNIMVESGISTTDLINAGVGQQALDKIFTLTEDPTVTTFKTPSSMESAFLRNPVLAAEAAARSAKGEDGVASLQAQARDYVSGLMEDGITDAERAEAQRIATERGITFQDFVNTGVDPTLLFKTPTPKDDVVKKDDVAKKDDKSKGAGLGTDIDGIKKAIEDGTALPPIPSGGAGAAAPDPFPDVTAQNPVTPTTVYDPAAFAAANAGADIYAKGQTALDTQFRDSAPRTAIPNMPGQYDYTPAAKLLSATGSGYSFTPPSVTSRRRSLLSPLAIQQAGGLTSASQRFARDRQTIGNFLRGRLGSSKYGNTAAFNQFRNRLMSGEFGDVRQAMADGSLFDVNSDINRRFNAAYTKYESDMDSAAPTPSTGTSPTAAAGSIAPRDLSYGDVNAGLQEAAYAGAGDTGYYGAIKPVDLRYGYAGFADGGLASLKKDEAEAAILASLSQGPSDTDQTESATMLQNILAGAQKIPSTVYDYGKEIVQSEDPLAELGEDVGFLGSAMYEGFKEDKAGFLMDMAPIIGEIRSGADAGKYSGLANKADAAGNKELGDIYRQISTMSAAGAVPLLGMGARATKRSAINAAEEAIERGALSDATRILSDAGESNYPLAKDWYGDQNYKETGGKLVYMDPAEYLSSVRPLKMDDLTRENVDELKRHIQQGGELDPLAIYPNGLEDGRHRAIAAQELGLGKVPVLKWDKTESAKMLDDLDQAGSPDFIKTVDQIASSTGTPSVRKSTETGVPFVPFTEEYAAQVARTLPEPTNSKGYPGADVANLKGVKGDPIAETWNRQIASDPMGMLELYKKHPETDGGKVHDTDVFRELNPNYLADRTIATSVHEPSGALNNMFYEMKLAETQGQPGKWLFTGGGPASGKSSGLAGEMRKGADLVYDGSMATYDSVAPRIDAALASGKQVEVAFVLRDPEKAIRQAVDRAMKQKKEFGSGRTIPINYYAGMHVDARQTLKRLNERYADNDAFRVTVTSNQGGLDDIRQGTLDEVVDLDYDTTVRKVSSVLDEMKKEGVIDEDIYQGFIRNTDLEKPTTPTSVSDTGGTPKRRGDGQAADQSDSQLGQERVQVSVEPLEVGVDETLSGGQRLRNYTPKNLQTLEELASNASAGTKRADALINAPVETGTKVGIRLNLNSKIPNAPKGLDKLQTLHKNNFNGEALSYVPYATVENVVFNVSQKGRRGIAAKISGMDVPEAKAKFPAMSVDGNYVPDKNVLKEGGDFVEIGFNPKAHHLFIDMNTGQAVKGADLATVVGDRVYAKGVQYYKKSEAPAPLSASDGTDLPSQVRYQQMKSGGLVERATHNQTYI
jgi:hypothetical protein